ncbi:cytochrome P450 [Xylariaceae sp. FL0594]|nr:cytochrome P450 [Xylariaceae sp. FL0594]
MAVFLLLLSVGLLAYALYQKVKGGARMPAGARPLPGPKSYPIVGRVHDVPHTASWLKFHEWAKEYGPIYQTVMFGTVHVWISCEQIAHDLLSRRAAIYSDRPQIPNLPDNRTKGDYLALTGHNDTWRRQRKLCRTLMTASANASLHGYPSKERDRFLYLISIDTANYREYIEQFTSRTVARLSWGSPCSAQKLRVTTFGLLETISPTGALPNMLWWLMYLPACLSPWQQKENARHDMEAVLLKDNVRRVREQMSHGTAEPSFVRTFFETWKASESAASRDKKTPPLQDEKEASYVVGQMAIAGALTIGSPIQSFLLAMLHYPYWLKKLQREIDAVCGGDCPQWEDRESLPLLRAVIKEVIRWRPPVPTGIPHSIEKDDVYNGYYVPAGATIHALEWSIARDPRIYPDPDRFNPARWLNSSYPTYKEPLTAYPSLQGFSQFGFGRRTCQGLPIVDQDLFLAMGGLAWAFDIRKKRNPDGSEVPVHWNDYTSLLIAKPVPFEFEATVRNERVREQLKEMWTRGRGEDDVDLDEGAPGGVGGGVHRAQEDVERSCRACRTTFSSESATLQLEKGKENHGNDVDNPGDMLSNRGSDSDAESNSNSNTDSDARSGGTYDSSLGRSRSEDDGENGNGNGDGNGDGDGDNCEMVLDLGRAGLPLPPGFHIPPPPAPGSMATAAATAMAAGMSFRDYRYG